MMALLLEPFSYHYMVNAIWVCGLVGAVCSFLSAYLMLKGWSLMGDALAHSIVPGVALAYLLSLPYSAGAFFAGILAALSMSVVRKKTKLREDAVIGLIFSSFFALGLLIASLKPTAVSIQTIVLGNILAISPEDRNQVVIMAAITLVVLIAKWRDLWAVFFDEVHARTVGLPVTFLKILFFVLLSAATVSSLQTVGACLVIAMVVTPGSTAYLLTDRFRVLVPLSIAFGTVTSMVGVYLSYFLNASPGGLIVTLQTLLFLVLFVFAPKHGLLAKRRTLHKEATP
ncbi:metal ABC transporter permease [Bdellovibrio sp. HCB288]|uniref:metal ABC transporter permease n=1 Tax=Bdellovibrio sp. HCB288 TaxID=3394355 RepID=UPI0039B3FEAB